MNLISIRRLSFSILAVLISSFHGVDGANNQGKTPNFEFWNKSKNTVYIEVVQPPTKPTLSKLQKVGPGKRVQANLDLSKSTMLFLKTTQQDWEPIPVYIFPKNTEVKYQTIYVRLSEDGKKFGPQTGPWRGWTGKTESGLSLKNNIPEKSIISTGIPLPQN